VIPCTVLGLTAASASENVSYFPIRLGNGSVGPLRLGMTRAAALRYLRGPQFQANRNGVKCARYTMTYNGNGGDVAACFAPRRGLIGYSVSGPYFCFAPGICANGQDVLPKQARRGFVRTFHRSNATYYTLKRVRLRGRPYQIVLEGPSRDPNWTMRAMGFGPCGASYLVRYYVPVAC
jgi:hypothetical protein